MSFTILGSKDLAQTYQPIFLYQFAFTDGSTLYVSTEPLDTIYGGVYWNGNPYAPRVMDAGIDAMQALSAQGVDQIPTVTLQLADADGYLSTGTETSVGFKGATLTIRLVMFDPVTLTFSTDSILCFTGICDSPSAVDDETLTISAQNKLNFQRSMLPTVPVSRLCVKIFPASNADRVNAANTVDSPYYPCGYSYGVAGPNAVGNPKPGTVQPYTSCDFTTTGCIARLGNSALPTSSKDPTVFVQIEQDQAGRRTGRFAGITYDGPNSWRGHNFLTGTKDEGINDSNQDKYNSYMPLIYGKGFVNPIVCNVLGDPNSTRLEVILCWGQIHTDMTTSGPIDKVVVNDFLIPFVTGAPDVLLSWQWVNNGQRNGLCNRDAIYDGMGDPYGSISCIEIRILQKIAQSNTLPQVQILTSGPLLRVYTAPTVFSYAPNDNPCWILLDLLTRATLTTADIDLQSFIDQASHCAQNITYTDLDGDILAQHPRYRGQLIITQRQTAAEYITAFRRSFKAVLIPNNAGLLSLLVKKTMANEQPGMITGSNDPSGFPSIQVTGAPGNCFSAYDFDESSVLARPGQDGTLKTTLRFTQLASSDTPNTLGFQFQDEDFPDWPNDSLTLIDSQDVTRMGQQISGTFQAQGIPNFDQGKRVLETEFAEKYRGNPRFGQIGATFFITGASNTAPIVLTLSAPTTLVTGDSGLIAGVLGNTAANGVFLLTVIDPTHVQLDGSDGTASGAYTSGGGLDLAGSDSGGTWSFEFESNFRIVHLRLGHICRMSWAKYGIVLQPVRITRLQPASNFETVKITATWHQDDWYVDSYGQYPDPKYAALKRFALLRHPFGWCPNHTAPPTGDPMLFPTDLTFGIAQVYTAAKDGSTIAELRITGVVPVDRFTSKAQPPHIKKATYVFFGGILPGRYYLAISAKGTDGLWSALSATVWIDVPALGQITVGNLFWPNASTTAGWKLFAGLNPNRMSLQATDVTVPTSITIGVMNVATEGAPDSIADHFLFRVKKVAHAGVLNAPVTAVTSTSITCGGSALNAGGRNWRDYICSVIGQLNSLSDIPVANFRIDSSSGDVLTLRGLTPDPTSLGVNAGDMLVIRAAGTIATTSTIGDLGFSNGTPYFEPPFSIVNIDLSSPVIATTATAHNYSTGDLVLVQFVFGCTSANGLKIVTVLTPTTFYLDGTTSNGTYGGGGTVSRYVNSGGLVPDAETGRLVRIIAGTGRGQVRAIKSNTGTVVTLEDDWDLIPDASSIWIIEEPDWLPIDVTTTPTTNPNPAKVISVLLNVDNYPGQALGIQTYTESADGRQAIDSDSPFRDIWFFGGGSAANLKIVDKATFILGIGGDVATGTDVTNHYTVRVGGIPVNCSIEAVTPPAGADLIVDILVKPAAGGGFTSIFGVVKMVLPAGTSPAVPVLQTNFATTLAPFQEGDVLRMDVLQVGSGTAGQLVTTVLKWGTSDAGV